jgi:L-ascorbate metabolism protein UlaG (beta-lactamase superfamily)
MTTGSETSLTASVTYIGNATTVLRLGDFTLLTDPAFRPAGSRYHLGYGAWTRRLIDPACRVGDLPPLDAVLLSHLHSDHFDRVASRALPAELPIITTPQAQRRLRRRFSAVHGVPTWEEHDVSHAGQRLRITAVPGRHGPGVADRLLPDVMGSVVELQQDGVCRLRVYVTGDTLFRPWLAEIPRRCGDIDAMLIHLGGTRLLGMLLTMDARQGTNLTEVIRPRLTLPIHHDDFRVFTSPVSDYFARARDRGLTGVQPIGRGDTVALPIRHPTQA